MRLGPVTEECLERAVTSLRRSKMPPRDRGWYFLSFADRAGHRPSTAHLSALDMPPSTAVAVAEAAGMRLTLKELAGAAPPTRSEGTLNYYLSCDKRRELVRDARFFAEYCGEVAADEVFDVFEDSAVYFLRGAGMKISFGDFLRRVEQRHYLLSNYASVISDLCLERLREHFSRVFTWPDRVAEVLQSSPTLELTAENIELVLGGPLGPADAAKCALKYGFRPCLKEAAESGWSARDAWLLAMRDATLPETASFFADFPVAAWGAEKNAEWLAYRRAVRVLQAAFRLRRRHKAARKIQEMWKRVSSDPSHGAGRRRLARLFHS